MSLERGIVITAVSAVFIVACGGETASVVKSVTRHDSAGVAIIETHAQQWNSQSQWRVDSAPLISIGVTNGDTTLMFSEIVRALRLADGSILVLDGDSRQLRMFDSTGRLKRISGRSGRGPGEFGSLVGMERCGANEIWVQDFSHRISVWSLDADFKREFKTTKLPMWPFMCAGGVGVIVKEDAGYEFLKEPVNTIYSDSLRLFVASADSAQLREFLRINLWDYLIVVSRDQPNQRNGVSLPFGLRTVLAFGSGGLILSGRDAFEFRVVNLNGQLLKIVRGPAEDLRITPKLINEYRKAKLDFWDSTTRDRLESIDMPMNSAHPAVAEVRVDAEGNVWLKRFESPWITANRWAVFSRNDEYLGELNFPVNVGIMDIGSDYILANVRDSLDVERVQAFRLYKPGAAAERRY